MSKHISEERKGAYYIGMGLMILGGIFFASSFVSFISNFGDFSNFESNAKSGMMRAIGGMGLLVLGGIIRAIGARGLAGSGVILDPEKAREDLEPYSRMAGGMVKDAMDAADVNLSSAQDLRSAPEKIIMIKCRSCAKLNEEDSKFCQECGEQL